MKANPGKATFVNQNAAAQISGILMKQLTGDRGVVHALSRRGPGDAGPHRRATSTCSWSRRAVALPQVRAGTIKAFANLSPQRSPVDAGHSDRGRGRRAGLYMSGWFGLFAPKGTPKDAIAKLNGAMTEALADPAMQGSFAELGLDVATREQQTPEGLAAFHKAEIEKWWPIIKAAGIKAE